MATIIHFPTAEERSVSEAIEITAARLKKTGMPHAQSEVALAELRDAIIPLFRSLSLPVEIPADLDLTPMQVEGVIQIVEEFFKQVKVEHAKDISHAINVIAGLTARSALGDT